MRWFVLVLLLGALCGGGPAFAYDPAPDEAVFQKHCATCHSVERPLKKHKDRVGWLKTVQRMQGYAGGMIDDSAVLSIVNYLTHERGPSD